MSPTHSTVLSFQYPTPTVASRIEASIAVEVGALDDDRSAATVSREDSPLRVTVEATARVALRAGIHSRCRYVEIAERVADGVAGRQTAE